MLEREKNIKSDIITITLLIIESTNFTINLILC